MRIPTEARKARHRLYPVSIVYSLFSIVVLAIALNRRPGLAIAFYALGMVYDRADMRDEAREAYRTAESRLHAGHVNVA